MIDYKLAQELRDNGFPQGEETVCENLGWTCDIEHKHDFV